MRIKRNISQEDIARMISVTQPTYSRKERGKTEITINEWHNLAVILNVGLDEIYQDNNNAVNKENQYGPLLSPSPMSIENISNYKKQNSKLKDTIKMLQAELKKYRR